MKDSILTWLYVPSAANAASYVSWYCCFCVSRQNAILLASNLTTPSTINDYVVPNLNTEKILGEIIRDYMDVNVVNNVATYSNGGITLKRNLSDGLPIQDSLLVISALNLKINDAKLYTDISYKILAAYIKNGTFKTYGEVFLFFYPGNIRDTSIFGETRIVLGTSGLYLKQSIIDKIKYYI